MSGFFVAYVPAETETPYGNELCTRESFNVKENLSLLHTTNIPSWQVTYKGQLDIDVVTLWL